MVAKDKVKKTARAVSDDIKDVAKELAMLDADPTAEIKDIKDKVKETAKSTAKKATATAKKATAKATETAKKASAKASETAKKATTVAKKTATKAAASVTKDISKTAVVEFAGNQYEVTDVIARCEAKYKSENKKKTYKDIKVYIKPENNAAYYVVDDISAGMINLI